MYDYLFDQESCDWVHWMSTVPSQELTPSLSFNEIIVQTIDTVRYSHLMRLLITHYHHTLFTGMPTSLLPAMQVGFSARLAFLAMHAVVNQTAMLLPTACLQIQGLS